MCFLISFVCKLKVHEALKVDRELLCGTHWIIL